MSGIVERLRARYAAPWQSDSPDILSEAADEIEQLREEVARLDEIERLREEVARWHNRFTQSRDDNKRLRALLERIMPFAPEGLWQGARRALGGK